MNNYDSAYDELPECCCDGVEDNEKLRSENKALIERVKKLELECDNAKAYMVKLSDTLNRTVLERNGIEEAIMRVLSESLFDDEGNRQPSQDSLNALEQLLKNA